ncbi:JmjC domain-containing protein [Streptosporangium sp. NPDC001559]|uniref:JmjC domain-containing protein n=1 Tax=Streptosporangium sp. NPDC001559 TaxID=3366187 RepID=UPI0036E592AD
MFLHERWPPLKRVCQSLAAELTVGVHGNVYLTPAGAQGLQPHHDTHDVFVLQLYGTKHWRLYEPQTRLPLQSQLYRHTGEDPEVVTRELDLSPGDLMYLPRGTVHAATANEAASLHLTIGVVPVVWASLLRKAVDQAVAEDSRFREALPMGFALDETTRKEAKERLSGLFDDLRGALSADAVVEEAARTVLRRRQPALLGHLQDLEAVGAIDVTTPLRRRPGLLWHLAREGEQVMLTFHGKVVSFPAHVEDELNFLGTVDEFTGAGIPGALDEAGRMVLTRRLLREGFLTLA